MYILRQIFANPVVWTAVVSWAAAQFLKIVIEFAQNKSFDPSRLTGTGGMPSSHSSFVTALATAIGLSDGFGSTYFAISLALALIVMYDAQGVRRQAGKQAAVLNMIVRLLLEKEIKIERDLKELLGHTPIQVTAGAILGIVIAIIFHNVGIV
jgi:acid phosphatase family membrane protein YuiD